MGLFGLFFNNKDVDNYIIRGFTATINFTVGILIFIRKPMLKDGNIKSILISLSSLIFGGVIFKFSSPFDKIRLYSEILFLLGAFFTLVTFIFGYGLNFLRFFDEL